MFIKYSILYIILYNQQKRNIIKYFIKKDIIYDNTFFNKIIFI